MTVFFSFFLVFGFQKVFFLSFFFFYQAVITQRIDCDCIFEKINGHCVQVLFLFLINSRYFFCASFQFFPPDTDQPSGKVWWCSH